MDLGLKKIPLRIQQSANCVQKHGLEGDIELGFDIIVFVFFLYKYES